MANDDGTFLSVDPKSKEFLEIAAHWNLPCPILEICKVHNSRLWRKYQFTRSEICEQVGEENLNEEMLWHGTNANSAKIIGTEGFDHRVGVKNGRAYGDGIYFTQDAYLALRYSLGDETYKKMAKFLKRQSDALSQFIFGTPTPFEPRTDKDVMSIHGSILAQPVNVKYQAITMMRDYNGKSFEELRLEDYAAKRLGKVILFTFTTIDHVDDGFDDDDDDVQVALQGRFQSIALMQHYHDRSFEEVRIEDYRAKRKGVRKPFEAVHRDSMETSTDEDDCVTMDGDDAVGVDGIVVSSGSLVDGITSTTTTTTLQLRYQSISCMPIYANQSFEELRLEDYHEERKWRNCGLASLARRTSRKDSKVSPEKLALPASSSVPPSAPTFTFTTLSPPLRPGGGPQKICSRFFAQNSNNLSNNVFNNFSAFSPIASSSSASSSSALSPPPPPPPKLAFMLYSRVTLGVSTPGNASYTRPPPLDVNDLAKGRFNSCTGKLYESDVFVIFDNAQAFPEYVVKYEMDETFVIDS